MNAKSATTIVSHMVGAFNSKRKANAKVKITPKTRFGLSTFLDMVTPMKRPRMSDEEKTLSDINTPNTRDDATAERTARKMFSRSPKKSEVFKVTPLTTKAARNSSGGSFIPGLIPFFWVL